MPNPTRPPYVWDTRINSGRGGWRNTTTGRVMSHAQAIAMRDSYVTATYNIASNLAMQVGTGQISLQRWVLDMRTQIKTAYTNEYMLARGGRKFMTQADWGRIGNMCKNQYHFLNGFAAQIEKGMSPEQIALRARMYMDSATQAYERGQAANLEIALPAYPGDGSTECMSNCKCHWEIDEVEGAYECYWRLEPEAEHCDTCDERSTEWNPYIIPRFGR